MFCTSADESAVISCSPSGIAISCLASVETMAALSVSQNRYVPPASPMHFSSMAKSRRPPDVIKEAMCGANHLPGSSNTLEVVSNESSPEKHTQRSGRRFLRIDFNEQTV